MTRWQEATADHFRQLEAEQRVLAENASSSATREIHLEFAYRYRQQAEQLEKAQQCQAATNPGTEQA